MPIRDSGRCFACGKASACGLQLDIRKTDAGVEVDFVPPERFQGWDGIVHGGIVSTILDELLAWACTARGHDAVTGEIHVRFRQPMAVGKHIRGIGRITLEKGRLLQGESRLFDDSGQMIAEASGKMMKV